MSQNKKTNNIPINMSGTNISGRLRYENEDKNKRPKRRNQRTMEKHTNHTYVSIYIP